MEKKVKNILLSVILVGAMLIVAFYGSQAQAAELPTSGLIGYWKLDETSGTTAADSSGNNNAGTLVNSPSWIAGKVNNGLSLSNGQYIQVPHNSNLNIAGNLTIAIWVKPNSVTCTGADPGYVLFSKRTTNIGQPYTFYIGCGGSLRLNYWATVGLPFPNFGSTDTVSTGTWQHVAVTRSLSGNDATVTFYINSVAAGSSVESTGAAYTNSDPVWISRDGYFTGYTNEGSYSGLMDEVAIYNRALSASEIQAEYNALTSTPTPTTVPPTTVPPTTVPPTTVPLTTVPPTTVPPTTVPPTAVPPKAVTTPAKFRVGPSVTLRPVTDVIEANQDGIVELFMNNPSLNDVTLNVDARVSVPSGIHVYGESFGQAAGAGVVAGTFSVPPGTSRTIAVVIKADKSARIGSHTMQFTGLYYPGDNKDNYQPLSLTYSVTVKEPSKKPEEPPKEAQATATPSKIPGFGVVLAIFGVFAIARLLSRK